jgi:carbonic anhydrase
MKILIFLISVISLQAALAWDYKNPNDWVNESEVCGKGLKQSPIEIVPSKFGRVPKIYFNYLPTNFLKINDHGNLKFWAQESNTIEFEGTEYKLEEFHFHVPAEHKFRGKTYPMEVHFVNKSKDGKAVAIGVFFELGKTNKNIEKLLKTLRQNPYDLIPKDKFSYRYDGSLTTPPCSEGLKWVVLRKPITISREQLKKFRFRDGPTNRAIHPRNGRTVRRGY